MIPLRGAACLLAAALPLSACGGPADTRSADPRAALSVSRAMSGDGVEGYLRADTPRAFDFPADHGPHPGFRTEWWYFTGNLSSEGGGPDGRRFGYQLTFFRNALAPPSEMAAGARKSAWAAGEAWLAHFAVTDGTGSFYAAERLARGAAGLAGVGLDRGPHGDGRLSIRTEGWSVEPAEPAEDDGPNPAALAPLRLRAAQPEVAIDLVLTAIRPPVPHGLEGEEGLSRKGAQPGQASYYYSVPRFETRGVVTVAGRAFPVRGLSWLDREWSTSALSPEQEGWDWFALQLADGRDLMLYRLRLRGGGDDPASSGTLVGPDGSARHLAPEDFEIARLDRWRAGDGVVYPSGWRVRVPAAGIDLTIDPLAADQELDLPETGLRYWEGAVDARGASGGRSVTGRGYVELTGYADSGNAPR